jgi:hypothetical protein
MRAIRKPLRAPVTEDKQLPAATFKASLRAWQAQYRARREPQVPAGDAEKEQTPTVTA